MSYISTISPPAEGGTTNVSGNVVNISGQVVNISGQTVQSPSTSVATISWVSCTAASGGTVLTSGACNGALIQSVPDNTGRMFVGGTSANAPFSGKGLILDAGAAVGFDGITNFNQVRVFATVSGEKVSVIGELQS